MNPILEIHEIYKTYDNGPQKVEVLKGISLTVSEGEVIVIMGPSGVGKSTLLHVMGLLDLPTMGTVIIAGKDIHSLKNDALARFRNSAIGFVFQFHHLLPEFTAYENVIIPAMMHAPLSREKDEYARFLLNEVGLSQRMDHKPRELSGGEQQRVAVARALINKPKLLLADEPTGNLDKRNSELLYRLLLDLNQKLSQTLIIVSHAITMSTEAHRVIELDDGRISRDSKKKP